MAKKKATVATGEAPAAKASPKDYEVYAQHNIIKTEKHPHTGKVTREPVPACDACQCGHCRRVTASV